MLTFQFSDEVSNQTIPTCMLQVSPIKVNPLQYLAYQFEQKIEISVTSTLSHYYY